MCPIYVLELVCFHAVFKCIIMKVGANLAHLVGVGHNLQGYQRLLVFGLFYNKIIYK